MAEGCRLTSEIIDVDLTAVKIGMQVEAAFSRLGSEDDAGAIHCGTSSIRWDESDSHFRIPHPKS